MSALPSSYLSIRNNQTHFSSDSSLKPVDQCYVTISSRNLSYRPTSSRNTLAIRAGHHSIRISVLSGENGPNSATIFVGGFVLGGIVVGALGCVYAPQISKALAETDKKDLMRKLPKFIYDEEKALEKTRIILTQKIEQLNSAIDDVSAQLHADDDPPDALSSEEIEAAI